MEDIRKAVRGMMALLDFPAEAQKNLKAALDTLLNRPAQKEAFAGLLAQYEESIDCPYAQMFERMDGLSREAGLHPYMGSLLLLLAMAPTLRARYARRGLPDALFVHTMRDLRYKLVECQLVYGVDGTFVAYWYPGFYRLERFALGRLQFELVKLGHSGTCAGLALTPDTKAINIHIPRTGERLGHGAVLEAYRMAADFYREEFDGLPMVFTCESWLLAPWNRGMLPKGSNLRAFMADFTLIAQGEDPDYGEVWRLFDCLYEGDADGLPQDTSLRRAYAERIRRGLPVGWGQGVFLQSDLCVAGRGAIVL